MDKDADNAEMNIVHHPARPSHFEKGYKQKQNAHGDQHADQEESEGFRSRKAVFCAYKPGTPQRDKQKWNKKVVDGADMFGHYPWLGQMIVGLDRCYYSARFAPIENKKLVSFPRIA